MMAVPSVSSSALELHERPLLLRHLCLKSRSSFLRAHSREPQVAKERLRLSVATIMTKLKPAAA